MACTAPHICPLKGSLSNLIGLTVSIIGKVRYLLGQWKFAYDVLLPEIRVRYRGLFANWELSISGNYLKASQKDSETVNT